MAISSLLRGIFQPSEYVQVLLPLTILQRLAILEKTTNLNNDLSKLDPFLQKLLEALKFRSTLTRLEQANLLPLVLARFSAIDLSQYDTFAIGELFETLIHASSSAVNGDYYTPPTVADLMVHTLFERTTDRPISVYDPPCGSGSLLDQAEKQQPSSQVYGQDFNPSAYTVAALGRLLKGDLNQHTIQLGDTLTDDRFSGQHFNFMIANLPFNVDWKRQQASVRREHATAVASAAVCHQSAMEHFSFYSIC